MQKLWVLALIISHLVKLSLPNIIISDQLGLQPILERLTWFIKKSKQFNQSDIASYITTLTLTTQCKRVLRVCSHYALSDSVSISGHC